MKMIFYKSFFKSIIIFSGIIMLLACKNDINKIKELEEQNEEKPEMSGENLEMIYSDSALIKYKIYAPLYYKIKQNDVIYDRFPKGIHVISYDKDGQISGDIKAKYAHRKEDDNIWEARDEVIVTNAEGTKLETELLFWDMDNKTIYSPRYSRLTMKGNVIEGNNGFESDQDLKNPIFKSVTGEIEYNSEKK